MSDTRVRAFRLVTAVTFARLPLMLLFGILLLLNLNAASPAVEWACLALLIVAALTDLADGPLARRHRVQTEFGAYADPLMDKLYYAVALPAVTFLAMQRDQLLHAQILLVFTVTFLIRDQWVSFLRALGTRHHADVKANWSGKLRTLLAFPVICCAYALETDLGLPLPPSLIYTLELACLLINAISIAVYTRDYWPYLRQSATLPRDD